MLIFTQTHTLKLRENSHFCGDRWKLDLGVLSFFFFFLIVAISFIDTLPSSCSKSSVGNFFHIYQSFALFSLSLSHPPSCVCLSVWMGTRSCGCLFITDIDIWLGSLTSVTFAAKQSSGEGVWESINPLITNLEPKSVLETLTLQSGTSNSRSPYEGSLVGHLL